MRPNESQQLHSSHPGDDTKILPPSSREEKIECIERNATKPFHHEENQDIKTNNSSIPKESKNNRLILSCPVSIPLNRLDPSFVEELRNKHKQICASKSLNRSNVGGYLSTDSSPQNENVNQKQFVRSDEE